MSLYRHFRRSKTRNDNKDLVHLRKAVTNAEKLINAKVLHVYPDLHKATFTGAIWANQPMPNRKNMLQNIALYVLTLNIPNDAAAEMQLELFDEQQQLLGTYKAGKAEVWR